MMLDKQMMLDQALQGYRENHHYEAACEREYREAKAEKWAECLTTFPDTKTHTAGFREAWVNGQVAKLRQIRDHAVAESKASAEEVRNLRQELSSLQTAQRMMQEEMGFVQHGPDLRP